MRGRLALWCGGQAIEVDAALAEQARPRVHVEPFTSTASLPTVLRLERVSGLEGQRLEGPLGQCTVRLEGDTLLVDVGGGAFHGELALRLAYFVATLRQGGLLIHASALAHDGVGLLACGSSGAGKSTLARLGRSAGLVLLTDEIVQILPGGRLAGTPFRSDDDNVGAPVEARARYFATLEQRPREALEPLAPMAAATVLLAQCFSVEALAPPRSEVQRRALAFLSAVELRTLWFRKSPEAGHFVRQALASVERPGA